MIFSMLLFFVITIATSSAHQCYVCETYGNGNPATPQECPAGQNYCTTVTNNGNVIYRGCRQGEQSVSSGAESVSICSQNLCNGGDGGYC